jgi:hypothetical protein
MTKQTHLHLVLSGMAIPLVVFAAGVSVWACDGQPTRRYDHPVFECRDGYRVPVGDSYRDVTMSNGIACATKTDFSNHYGHVVCWNLHGCER